MSDVVIAPQAMQALIPTGSPAGPPGPAGNPGLANNGFATRSAMAAYNPGGGLNNGDNFFLSEKGREGVFVVDDASNWTANIAADTAQGLFVASSANAAKVYVRRYNTMVNVRWFGAKFDNATDDAVAIQAAENYLAAIGGGTLFFPPGIAQHSGITKKNKVNWLGAGNDTGSTKGTVLLYTGTGDGVVISNPYNSSTAANISIVGMTLKNVNVNAGKGCFADSGSSYLYFHRVAFVGSDRGLILDQSELVLVDSCDFEGVTSQTCLMWIVNGADRHAGASGGFTNMIIVRGSQFNGPATTVAIVDDGGYTHAFRDNNYNGCLNHIVAVGVAPLTVSGGEWESAVAACMIFATATFFGGGGVGQCGPVKVEDVNMVPTLGQHCVTAFSAGLITFVGGFYGNTTATKVNGAANCAGIHAMGMHNGGGGAMFDGMATHHFEMRADGTIATNMSGLTTVPAGGQLLFDDVGGATFQGYVERAIASPFRYHSIVSKGGAGGWVGAFRVQLNLNAGALFDAFKLEPDSSGTRANAIFSGDLVIPEIAAANVLVPPAGYRTLFFDTDHKLKSMNSVGGTSIIGTES